MEKTATLLSVPDCALTKRFFVRTIEENGECLESGDYNLYKSNVEKVEREYRNLGYIVKNQIHMKKKTVKVHFRTGGTERKIVGVPGDLLVMPETYKSTTETVEVSTPEELFEKYPPTIKSDKLVTAIEEALSGKRESVVYNFGKGNATFHFEK